MAGRAGKPIRRIPAGTRDAGALVPLCVRQSITPRTIALYKAYDAVVWWATPVEIASAGPTGMDETTRLPTAGQGQSAGQSSCRLQVRDSALGRFAGDVDATGGSLRLARPRFVSAGGGTGVVRIHSSGPYLSDRRSKVARCSPARELRCQAGVISEHTERTWAREKLVSGPAEVVVEAPLKKVFRIVGNPPPMVATLN